ncbi:hypothetical protein DFQ30_008648, partial [Apophysomyces sp. BC1015]
MSLSTIPMIGDDELFEFLSTLDMYRVDNDEDKQDKAKKQRPSSSARIGFCKHPKHALYRQHTAKQVTTPRRGRPPKGTKAADFLVSDNRHLLEMTVRPLPKRLEAA